MEALKNEMSETNTFLETFPVDGVTHSEIMFNMTIELHSENIITSEAYIYKFNPTQVVINETGYILSGDHQCKIFQAIIFLSELFFVSL